MEKKSGLLLFTVLFLVIGVAFAQAESPQIVNTTEQKSGQIIENISFQRPNSLIKKTTQNLTEPDNQIKLIAPNVLEKNNSAAGWTNIMTEDFEGTFPGTKWTLSANGNSSEDGYGYTWDEDDYKPHSGTMSGWCADGSFQGKPDLDPQTDNYPNLLNAWMEYGPFDLTNATAAELNFWYWNLSETSNDYLWWMASVDGATYYGAGTSGNSNGWISKTFDLKNVYTLGNLCGQSQVWIAFIFSSNSSINNKGAFLDDIVLRKEVELLTVTAPNGGEEWIIGTTQNITWTSIGTSGTVKIWYSTNGGVTWNSIISSTADDGSYAWVIPNYPSTNCLIRISDTDNSPVDESDKPFTIKAKDWKVPITVKSENYTFTRTIGGAENGSDNFDTGQDIQTAPPGMTYYAYLGMTTFPNYLDTDIRGWKTPYTTNITWKLKIVNTSGKTSTLTWDPTKFPEPASGYTFDLEGSNFTINMKNQNSIQISGDVELSILYRISTVTFSFSKQGWYLISLPVNPANKALSSLFPTALGAYSFNSVSQSYTSVTMLEPKKGYWLLIPGATTSTISGTLLTTYTEHYNMGWHLIGSTMGINSFLSPDDTPDNSVLSVYGHDSNTGNYYQVYPAGTGKLNEKEGYWLAVIKSCDLTVPGAPPLLKGSDISETDIIAFEEKFGKQPPPLPAFENSTITEVLIPQNYELVNNFPNPFNPETTIAYSLPHEGSIKLAIYNSLGQLIRTLVDSHQSPGTYSVIWDAKNELGETVPSGIYFYQLSANDVIVTRKMTLLK